MSNRESVTGEVHRRQYRFGDFVLDVDGGFLRRNGQEVSLRPKAFEVLKCLVLKHGRLVSKTELVEAVWPDAAVTDNSLSQCLVEVRRAIDDDAQTLIRTVARRGYVFDAPVSILFGDPHRSVAESRGTPAPMLALPTQSGLSPIALPVSPGGGNAQHASWPSRRLTLTVSLVLLALVGVVVTLWRDKSTPISEREMPGRFLSSTSRPLVPTPSAAPKIRLAVVPFENLTGDPSQDYFSDGLTEELIAQLGRLAPQWIQVIGRASVMRYKGGSASVDQVGRDLGVDYILSGSARRDATHVRVTAHVVRVRDQSQMWSETYDRDLGDILALQSDVAQRVTRGLALQLLPSDQPKASRVDPEAYDLYLQGRAQFNSGPLALDRAQQLFEQALQKNPNDALSYAGIASVWDWRGKMYFMRGKDAAAKSKAAAVKAVALDDTLADSHAALARAYMFERDWPRAEAEFKRALELNPNHADSHFGYAVHLALNGRTQDAMTQIDWAATLDPFNGMITLGRGTVLLAAGRLDEVIRSLRSSMASTPGVLQFHWVLWRTLHARGSDDDALTELVALNKGVGDVEIARALERGYAAGGYREAMSRAAALYEARAKVTPPFQTVGLALVQHDAGNRARAFVWMEQAIEDSDPNLSTMGILAPALKSDPQFRDLMQRIGLPY